MPELRFRGFIEEWEEKLLGEVSDITKLAGFEFTKYITYSNEGDIIALRGLNVKDTQIILEDVKYIDRSDFSKLERSKLYKNDILFTYVGTIGEVAIIPENNKYYLAPNVARIRLRTGIDSRFIIQMIGSSSYYDHEIFPLIATSSQPALSMGNIRKFQIKLPVYNEQEKHGCFFRDLDTLIALHQRKHDKLLTVKKAMLEKMFPKEGAELPEIRFKGFAGKWVSEKLIKLFDFLSNNTLSRAELNYSSGIARNIHYGDILIRFGEIIDVEKDTVPFITNEGSTSTVKLDTLRDGDIVIADTAEDEAVGKCSEVINTNGEAVVSGLHTMPSRPNKPFALGYLGYFMNSPAYHDQLMSLMQGTKVLSISKTALRDTCIHYPRNLEEQGKISTFFQRLDSLISLHARELDKLKNIKKSCLEKMFV